MLALLGLSTIASLIGCSVIGVRLLLLYGRSRQLPELIMGSSFLFGGVIGYIFMLLGTGGAQAFGELRADAAQGFQALWDNSGHGLSVADRIAAEGTSVSHKNLAMVGFGDLGQRVCRRLRAPWRALGLRRNADAVPAGVRGIAVDFARAQTLNVLEALAPEGL